MNMLPNLRNASKIYFSPAISFSDALYFFSPFICDAAFCASALAVCSTISLASQGYSHFLLAAEKLFRYPDIADLLSRPISLSCQLFGKFPLFGFILVMQDKDPKLRRLMCTSTLSCLFGNILLQLPHGITQRLRSVTGTWPG